MGMNLRNGITLIELLIVILLIPLLGMTILQVEMVVQNYFNRISADGLVDQEAELALGFLEKDIVQSVTLAVCDAAWNPVPVGTTENRLELTIDDTRDIPQDTTN